MKSSRSALILLAAFALRADLTKWAENIDVASRLEAVFFRNVAMPGGQVPVRRPPKETVAELSRLITAAPNDAELYSLRALEAEQQLDFAAAENDWKKYIDVAQDKGAARLALADYNHRRHQPQQEFEALTLAARELAPASERLLPETQQRPWKTYERLIKLVDEQRLDPALGMGQYGEWVARFPKQAAAYTGQVRYALDHNLFAEAEQSIAQYQTAFPNDPVFPVGARSEGAAKRGQTADAIAIFERNFQPLWPDALVKQYFDLLARAGRLREAAAKYPFHYWKYQNNIPAARRALAESRQQTELLTLAKLSESVRDYDGAARSYYALYTQNSSEDALAGLARLLLTAPEQEVRFGSNNLSLYRDVASMDPHPGFLNGVLSLVLNGTEPSYRHTDQERNAAPYFRRAQGAELVALLDSRFPNSPARTELRELAIEAYGIHGDSAAVLQAGAAFLRDFPNATNRTAVSLRIADAYARTNQTAQEFAQYDAVLAELAQRADNVPVGTSVRSPEYARVLARYVARLVALKRLQDALALYRREIDRNPNDPGLYDLMAAFLEQNQLGAEIEQVYQRAIAQFQEPSWRHKLARWYLRQQRQADLNRLTQDVVRIFSGTDLEAYFREIVTQQPLGPALYLQLNLAANQRFPHQLSFVRNLLTAYTTQGTANDAAYEVLLRQHWYHADDLRMRFFERLSRTGRLAAELAQARTISGDDNPALTRLIAEGELWRGHYEDAAPRLQTLVMSYPADRSLGQRTAATLRSLGSPDAAVSVESNLSAADPLDHASLTRAGEIQADRERFTEAGAAWDKIPEIEPAKPEGYLEAATIFWDYYRYDDALRWIDTARTRLGRPALYAYQAGAIHENRRDYDRAMREYARGAIDQPQGGSGAERRLIALARRPALRQPIEQLTDNLVSARNPDAGSFNLRVALLKSQNRRDDLEGLLLAIAARADSAAALTAVESTAQTEGFPRAEQAALERRVAITSDPVDRMSLRLALARLHDGQARANEGAQVIDGLYRENPAILGVVRAAVDYHWRSKNTRRAVDVLEEAAGRAEPGYRTQFLLEAARKATESADYARARGFCNTLLTAEPLRAEYIAVMADTYARQGDDAGLRAFYSTKITSAAIRRALIPVLVRMRDFTAAIDQYIEIINRYPEDEGLAREAAQFARANSLEARLRDYYTKAANDSPKDYRWAMALGRIETQFENYPAAIAAFTRAAGVRPDRADLWQARLNLEERLLRFDEAGATAERLYELTYRNAQWMEKLAEIRARQGRNADAVAALNKAWIEGRSEDANNYFNAAQKLEAWGMLAEARRMAQEGLRRAGSNRGELVFARVATRLRDTSAVFTRLDALDDPLASQVAGQIGSVVATYYTPDEKLAFARNLTGRTRRLELARAAGLRDLEVRWLYESIMSEPDSDDARRAKDQLIRLQTRRLRFAELGRQLEAYDRALPANAERRNELEEAAASFRAAGDVVGELRVLQRAYQRSSINPAQLDRFAALLAARPAQLYAVLALKVPDEGNYYGLFNDVVQRASPAVAQQAIATGRARNGVLWARAYTSLVGLYHASATPAVRSAFTGLLGDMTIGARVGKAVDRNAQLAGDEWFYYAGRFGEYLAATKQAGAEDYLPAMLEAAPGRSDAYFDLGEYFAEAGGAQDYRYALELEPLRADVHDRLAVLAARAGRTDEAVAEWRLAFQAFTDQMNGSRLPSTFWGEVGATLGHIGAAKMTAQLREPADAMLRLYVRRNGSFQVDPLLTGAIAFAGDAAAGVTWIADLSRSASDPVQFLRGLMDREWIPDAQRGILHERLAESARARIAQTFGTARVDAEVQAWNAQIDYAEYLTDRRDGRARQVLDALPEQIRKERSAQVAPLDIRLAARAGQLAARVAQYGDAEHWNELRDAATALRRDGDAAGARRVSEFLYGRMLAAGNTDVSTFLGLAEVRLAENDMAGAVALLRRAALVSGAAFSALDPAAELLERTGHRAEASEFLTSLTRAEPWNADARRRLGAAPVRQPVALAAITNPYDYESRVENGTAAALEAAIAINPDPIAPKVALFRATVAARRDSFALALGRQFLPAYLREEMVFTEGMLDEVPEADRAAVARGLAEANRRVGNLRAASVLYRVAGVEAPAAMRVQMELQARNETRRPRVHKGVEQDRAVRPRVVR